MSTTDAVILLFSYIVGRDLGRIAFQLWDLRRLRRQADEMFDREREWLTK